MDSYLESMQTALRDIDPYFSATELLETHETAKNESISQFLRKRKLGSDDLISSFVRRIENTTEERFLDFQLENNEKRKAFIDKANLHNGKLVIEIRTDSEKEILNEIERMESISAENLKQLLEKTQENALSDFDAKKLGDSDITSSFFEKMQHDFDDFKASIETMFTSYKDSVNFYSNPMQNMLNKSQSYATHSFLAEMHQNSKNEAIKQFQLRSHGIPAELMSTFEHKIVNVIERNYSSFFQENEVKRNNFISRARIHNADLVEEIESGHWSSAYAQVDNAKSYLSDSDVWNIFLKTQKAALEEYDSKKMGDSNISSAYRAQLEEKMSKLKPYLEAVNADKRSKYKAKKAIKTGAGAAGGAAAGAVIAGPAGAFIGGIVGGAAGYFI
ncbi:uncharacterized protein LOC129573813 [Sitodiplosis mosellana]|uniref:uncharacterized protein LOC129573813 n=1 Tax=Sitodiplosis mosellana TaxID=263140 RepID=UPI002443FF7B|nr:uncharacterized protein LOC129573813 [Sitodiplosis mosellana]